MSLEIEKRIDDFFEDLFREDLDIGPRAERIAFFIADLYEPERGTPCDSFKEQETSRELTSPSTANSST